LSEFRSNTKPDKHNFPSRNRVVAGISDVTIIMESGSKGGSMITADIAAGYNRDVFALPGRISDSKSTGCNQLIMNNKAMLFYDTEQFINVMGWGESKKKNAVLQKQLFIDLSENEKKIVGILREKDCLAIDELNVLSGISTSAVAAALLNLEMNNMTRSMPGKRYMLTD
jgi:DNA processing protein